MTENKKTIAFDSGPIISLSTSNLLYLFERLKKKSDIRFVITPKVKAEIVDEPILKRRFELEALLVMNEINNKVIHVAEDSDALAAKANELLALANSIYYVGDFPMAIVHGTEIEVLAYCLINKLKLVCIDERNTRLLIEDPLLLKKIMSDRLHKNIIVNDENLKKFKELTKSIRVIRSSEIAITAVEHNMLDLNVKVAKQEILNAMLWSLKLHGCTISEKEIEEAKKLV